MYDLGRLRVLRELSHRGSLAKVAEALSYSPSTISQQLTQLEREVGVSLLEPDGRGVRLTPQAQVLVGHVERILQVIDEAQADIAASLTTLTGTVRIAAFQSAMAAYVPALVETLAHTHPGLRVEASQLEPEVAIPRLRARELDLVLTERYPGDATPWADDLAAAPLADDPLWLVVPSGHQVGRRGLAAMTGAQWVLEPTGTTARQWAESVCRGAGFVPDVRFEATDLRLHLDLVRTGRCVALLPGLALVGAPEGGWRKAALPGSPQRTIESVVRRGSADHPAIAAVRAALGGAQASS